MSEIIGHIDDRLDSDGQDTASRQEVLAHLLSEPELRTCGISKLGELSKRDIRSAFLSLWNVPADFFKDVAETSLDKIIKTAIHDQDMTSRRMARTFLEKIGKDSEFTLSSNYVLLWSLSWSRRFDKHAENPPVELVGNDIIET
jgi:hypothetical protein